MTALFSIVTAYGSDVSISMISSDPVPHALAAAFVITFRLSAREHKLCVLGIMDGKLQERCSTIPVLNVSQNSVSYCFVTDLLSRE